jgi:hypothetical protein
MERDIVTSIIIIVIGRVQSPSDVLSPFSQKIMAERSSALKK